MPFSVLGVYVSKPKAYLELIRPVNVLIAFAAIFVGAFITGTIHPLARVTLACISGALVAAGGNSINDFYDVDIDRINKPRRPLPSGQVAAEEALLFSLILLSSGVILGFLIGPKAFLIALFCALLLVSYSARLKRMPLWGNLAVSTATGLAFIYGGLAVGRFQAALIPAGFAFLFHLGREIIKDIEDFEGDVGVNTKTIPICWGVRWALGITTGVFLCLIALTLFPFFFRIYRLAYLVVVVLGVDLVLVYVIFSMWANSRPANLARLSTILKADMVVGLLAICLGR